MLSGRAGTNIQSKSVVAVSVQGATGPRGGDFSNTAKTWQLWDALSEAGHSCETKELLLIR